MPDEGILSGKLKSGKVCQAERSGIGTSLQVAPFTAYFNRYSVGQSSKPLNQGRSLQHCTNRMNQGAAAMISISTLNSSRVNPETIRSVEAGGVSRPAT